MVKSLPAMQETQVWSLGREDPLEKEMATHSGILAWRIPWMEEPGGLESMGSQRVRHDRETSLHWEHWSPVPLPCEGSSQMDGRGWRQGRAHGPL